mmetsp:Transcript_36306/g.104499  ORF Transcript_36306/g.104499 Transcript_36306/m.104499 type:complete len:263 (+) Transcript_36306:64-852(+)
MASADRLGSRCRKTKMCKYLSIGLCARGADCSYAHDASELVRRPNLMRTKMCPAQAAYGRCDRPRCRFAHDRAELRQVVFGDGREAGSAHFSARSQAIASPPPQAPSVPPLMLLGLQRSAVALLTARPPPWSPTSKAEVDSDVGDTTPSSCPLSFGSDWQAFELYCSQSSPWESGVGPAGGFSASSSLAAHGDEGGGQSGAVGVESMAGSSKHGYEELEEEQEHAGVSRRVVVRNTFITIEPEQSVGRQMRRAVSAEPPWCI